VPAASSTDNATVVDAPIVDIAWCGGGAPSAATSTAALCDLATAIGHGVARDWPRGSLI